MKSENKVLIKLTYGLIILLSTSSCFHVYFDQPQPKNGIKLPTVPDELHGKWIDVKDTFYIDGSGGFGYDFDSISGNYIKDGFLLSDSILLYRAGNYYVVNYSKDRIWWEVEIIERKENGDLYFYYPSKAPYFGKRLGLRVDKIEQEFEPVWLNDSIGRNRHVLFKKSLKMNNVMSRNAIYYKGQFRIKDIKKVTILDNLTIIYKHDGTREKMIKVSEEHEIEADTLN